MTTKLNVFSASSFVVANMIGTGVFTTLGFQLLATTNPVTIALIWLIGGITALCGALVYSELGSAMTRSGGEYHYLSALYHPAIGFMAGWVSIFVGFAAPVALASMAMSSYLYGIFPVLSPKIIAVAMLTLITLLHAYDMKVGTGFQTIMTICKILVIIVFVSVGLLSWLMQGSESSLRMHFEINEVVSPAFAIALIWVYYAYSGWNAAAYIANDIKDPQRNVPKALLISTAFVIVLYLAINMVFMLTTPAEEMAGQIEIGLISARHIFGQKGGEIMGGLIVLMLASSISSMVFIGPRVGKTMGEDHRSLRFLTKSNKKGSPNRAIWVQWGVSVLLILTGSFKIVTEYTGIVLSFCSLLTVLGIFIHRYKFREMKRPFKVPLYPLPPIIFSVVIIWSIVYLIYEDYRSTFIFHTQQAMWTTIASTLTLLSGLCIWFVQQNTNINKQEN